MSGAGEPGRQGTDDERSPGAFSFRALLRWIAWSPIGRYLWALLLPADNAGINPSLSEEDELAQVLADSVYAWRGPKLQGLGIIFNHFFANGPGLRREGTLKDENGLRWLLTDLGLDVEVFRDKTKAEIDRILRKVAAEDHTKTDILLIAVLTHGGMNTLAASDVEYSIDQLWLPFLAGKPIVFLIEACRGTLLWDGVGEPQPVLSAPCELTNIPRDCLVAHATTYGYGAFLDPRGSAFVQALIWIFQDRKRSGGQPLHLAALLTEVNTRVANHSLSSSSNLELHGKRQRPCFQTTLTKDLYLW